MVLAGVGAGATIAELKERMGSSEFVSWRAFANVEPIGDMRADMRTALIVAAVANTGRNPKKRSEPFQPGDFMPDYWQAAANRAPQDWRTLKQKVQVLAAAFGGKTRLEEPQ